MLKFGLLYLILFSSIISFSQSNSVIIHVENKDVLRDTLGFYFKKIELNTANKYEIGYIPSQRNKSTFDQAVLDKNIEQDLLKFTQDRFRQNKKGLAIILKINALKLAQQAEHIYSDKDSFIFKCNFIGVYEDRMDTLYSFQTRNNLGSIESASADLEYSLNRAIKAAIFRFANEFSRHREWRETSQKSSFQTKAIVFHNKFKSPDTIACEKKYQLQNSDYEQNSKPSNPEQGFSKLILTYQALSEEDNKGILLTINTKAFLQKSRSWIQKTTNFSTWSKHQQGHFDLCTVFGYKLKDSMQNHQYSIGEYKSELNGIFNKIYTEYTTIRGLYEFETKAGEDAAAEALWRKKIDLLLKEVN